MPIIKGGKCKYTFITIPPPPTGNGSAPTGSGTTYKVCRLGPGMNPTTREPTVYVLDDRTDDREARLLLSAMRSAGDVAFIAERVSGPRRRHKPQPPPCCGGSGCGGCGGCGNPPPGFSGGG